ncbi:peptidase S24/S26A/S26B/S26C, partial [Hysterangium stoloniferum]
CGTIIFTEYIGGPRIVNGPSMLPRMDADPQLIIEDTLSSSLHNAKNIQRGDLVTFRAMYDPRKHVCKRVIGLAGDVICVHPERSISVQHVVVPKGHIWVTGDNMSNSRDSREFGPIPLGMVRGKVLAKVWDGFFRVFIDINNLFSYIPG